MNVVPIVLAAQAPVDWETNLLAAEARAMAERKPILMVVSQSSCLTCTTFKQEMAATPGIQQTLLGVVPLDLQLDGKDGKVDPERMAVAQSYNVKEVPAVLLLDSEGKLIRIIGGSPRVQDLAPFIEGRPRPSASGAPAQSSDPASVSAAVLTRGLSFPEPKHDFGAVTGDLELKHRFKAANTGSTPVTIKEARASCGCTSTLVGKSLLAPGESGEIEAIFNTKGQHGKVAKTIQVISDDATNPTLTLTLEAEVTPEIIADPPEVQFVEVQGKDVRMERVRLKSGRNEGLRVTNIATPGADYLTATAKQEALDGVFMGSIVEFRFDPTRVPGGQLAGLAMVQIGTSNAKAATFSYPVRWTLKQAISTQPVGFYWNEAAGEPYQGRVTLRQLAARTFKVLSAKASNPAIQVKVPLHKPAMSQEATVLVPGTIGPGQYSETITFTTDDPDQPVVVVPVRLLLRGKQG